MLWFAFFYGSAVWFIRTKKGPGWVLTRPGRRSGNKKGPVERN